MKNPVLVEVVRGPLVESRHRAAVVVCDREGRVAYHLGEPEQVVYPRSSLKPFQALSFVESGAMDAFGLGSEQLALHCGSHNGEPDQVALVSRWLDRIGCTEDQLTCKADRPLGERWLHLQPSECAPVSKLANNCSGKHAGFLTTAGHLAAHSGSASEGYAAPDHPVQLLVRRQFAALAGVTESSMPVGKDNCGAPVFGVPLKALARATAHLGHPRDVPGVSERSQTAVLRAMRRHPHLVAGTGRADTLLMSDPGWPGISKVGAEGVFIAADPASGLGLALKVEDGADRASSALGIAVLSHIGLLPAEAGDRLLERIAQRIILPDGEEISTLRVLPLPEPLH